MTRGVAIRADRVFLRRASRRTVTAMSSLLLSSGLTVRLASTEDRRELLRLAELDSAEPLHGSVLTGRVDGELRAALSLETGASVADPFFRTAGLVALLEVESKMNHLPQPARILPLQRRADLRVA